MRLCDIASYLGADLADNDLCTGFALDSRLVNAGNVFVCFKGARVDGHDYLAVARDRGAVLAIVETLQPDPLPQLQVDCVLQAMVVLASRFRASWQNTKVVCVTGSAGKTTTKDMLKAICSAYVSTYATYQNQNNLLGLSLTLLNKTPESKVVVLELGINAPGEMQALVELACPDIAIITNVGACHLEGLQSEACIAHEKSQIFSQLGTSGVAIFSEDSPYKDVFYAACPESHTLTYSASGLQAAVQLSGLSKLTGACYCFQIVSDECSCDYQLAVAGQYQVYNATVAIMAAMHLGIPVAVIAQQLRGFTTQDKRFEQITLPNGAVLIEDCYNANPLALRAALATVRDFMQPQKLLVLGDMLELGDQSESLHRQIGSELAGFGITRLFTYGKLAACAGQACRIPNGHYDSMASLVAALSDVLDGNAVVLVKGSRGLRLERVRQLLLAGEAV